MDHRSGSASQGTSPLKAAGFLVGLLVVVALAFALGMKAGRELDVLRPEHGGETVKLGDAKTEPKAESKSELKSDAKVETKADAKGAGDGTSAPRREDAPASKRAELADGRHDTPAPATRGVGAEAPVGDEAPAATSTAAAGEPKPATPAPGGPDYSIFKATAGGAAAKTAAGSTAPAAQSAADPAAKASPPKSIDTATAVKEAAAERQAKAAAAKPAPAAPAKPAPAAAASAGALKITPDAPSAADKASPGFVVQVAALQSKGDADQLATRLRAHGAAPYINKVELPNGTWYRVRVGKFKTPAEAKAAQKKLTAAGFRGAEVMSAR